MARPIDWPAASHPARIAALTAALLLLGGHGAASLEAEPALSSAASDVGPRWKVSQPDSRQLCALPGFAPDARVSYLKLFRGPRG